MSNKDNIEEEDELWCHYSNMLSPMAYVKCEECGELKSVCECDTIDEFVKVAAKKL